MIAFASRLSLVLALCLCGIVPASAEAPAETSRGDGARKSDKESPVQAAIRVFRRETRAIEARQGSGSEGAAKQNPLKLFHGRAYEYIRNNAFDAVPHEVVQNGGDRNILRRNQFGLNVTGPVFLPKLYDGRGRTFFSFSFEGTRERVGRSYLRTLPTAAQRAGDFSGFLNKAGNRVDVFDPASSAINRNHDPSIPVSRDNPTYHREQFPNGVIPESRRDPVALAILDHYPLPNTDIGPFQSNNYFANSPEVNQPNGYIAKIDHRLAERHQLTIQISDSRGFRGQPDIYPTAADPGSPDLDFVDRELDIEETFTISPNAIYTGAVELTRRAATTPELGAEGNVAADLGLAGVPGPVFPTLRLSGFYGLGASNGSFYRNYWTSYETRQGFRLQRGAHSWRVSSVLQHHQLNTFEPESPSGYFRFNRDITGLPGVKNTGSGFATLLLGESYSAEVTDLNQPSYLRRNVWQTSFGDTYQANDNLTLSLSLNLDVATPRVEHFDRQSTISFDVTNPENGRPGALVFAGRDGVGRGFQPLRTRLEPTLGVSWSPTKKRQTVMRVGYRWFYSSVPLRTGSFATQGYSSQRNYVSANRQLNPAVLLRDGAGNGGAALPDLSPAAANGTDADLIPQSARQPRYAYVNYSIERRLPMSMTVRLRGTRYSGEDIMVRGYIAGLNAVNPTALVHRDELNVEAFRRQLRPFPQFQQIDTNGQYPFGRFRMNSTTLSLQKRASQGLTLDFDYTYRTQFDDYSGPGVQNYYDRTLEWSRSRSNRPHRVSLSYVYDLPLGSGSRVLRGNGLLAKIAGDWSVSGSTRWLSGDPVALDTVFNNTGGIVPYLRVNGVDGENPVLADPSANLWFNPAAFVEPDSFTLGNVPRTHPTLSNPIYQNHDLALTKRVAVSSEQSLELLLQSFNFINHANWNDPDSEIGPAEAPNLNAGRIIGSRGGRVVQLGLRYNF